MQGSARTRTGHESQARAPLRSGHFERKIDKPERDTIGALETALEALGAVFIDENGGGIGVRLKFTESEARRISRMEAEGGIVASDRVP